MAARPSSPVHCSSLSLIHPYVFSYVAVGVASVCCALLVLSGHLLTVWLLSSAIASFLTMVHRALVVLVSC